MENNETFNRNLRFFVIMTNIVFWLMLGYSPVVLIAYAAFFLTAIISFNVTLSYIYLKHKNLLYCIIMHQMFNFLGGLFNIGTDVLPADKGMVIYLGICAVCYALVAVVTVLINKDMVKVSDELV